MKLNIKVKQQQQKIFIKIKRPIPADKVCLLQVWEENQQVKHAYKVVDKLVPKNKFNKLPAVGKK